jgi:hypothetical protein
VKFETGTLLHGGQLTTNLPTASGAAEWRREEKNMTLIVRREVGPTPKGKDARTMEVEANAHFAKCLAERRALIAAGRADDEDNDIDLYCHFDSEGYAEPCDEYGRLKGMEATNDQRAEETGAANGGTK